MAEGIVKSNCFIVGAAKAGTTSIYHYLSKHPDVYMSPIKESNYFAKDIDTSKFSNTFKQNLFTDLDSYFQKDKLEPIQQAFVQKEDQYNKLFEESHAKINCDASTNYLSSTAAAPNIYDYNPEAKIIIILREPKDRTFSHYLMALRFGFTTLSLTDAIQKDIAQTEKGIGQSEMFLELSQYAEQVDRYLKVFPKEQVQVLFFEDLKRDQEEFMSQVYSFLDIQQLKLENQGSHNEAQVPRFLKLNQWLTNTGIKKALLGMMPQPLKKKLKGAYMSQGEKPVLTEDETSFLNQHLGNVKTEVEEILGKPTPW